MHAPVLAVWVVAVGGWRWYGRWYHGSLAVDLAVAALTVTAFGNLIDRIAVGGTRDWWVTPIAIANLADNAHWLTLAAIAWELWRFFRRHVGSRPTLRLDPRRWVPPVEERPEGSGGHQRRRSAC